MKKIIFGLLFCFVTIAYSQTSVKKLVQPSVENHQYTPAQIAKELNLVCLPNFPHLPKTDCVISFHLSMDSGSYKQLLGRSENGWFLIQDFTLLGIPVNKPYWSSTDCQTAACVIEGKYIGLYDNNIPSSEAYYQKGILHGKYTSWNFDGSIVNQGDYEHGKKDGVWLNYENKKLVSKHHYKADNLDGEQIEYYGNGRIKKQYSMLHGKLNGLYIENDELPQEATLYNKANEEFNHLCYQRTGGCEKDGLCWSGREYIGDKVPKCAEIKDSLKQLNQFIDPTLLIGHTQLKKQTYYIDGEEANSSK